MKNPDLLEKIKQKKVSLIGVTKEEEQAIIESLGATNIRAYWWM